MSKREQDQALVQACVNGERQAWDDFVDRFGPVVYAAVSRTLAAYRSGDLHADIQDVAQDVFVRLLKRDMRLLKTYDSSRASLSTWLTLVARSTTLNFLNRRRPVNVEIEEDMFPVPPPEPASDAITIPTGLLSPRQKLVLTMLFDDERDVREVAGMLKITEQSVRSLKHKALEKLRAFMTGNCDRRGEKPGTQEMN